MATFETLAQGILNFVNWGITIITIMAIWEAIAWATGYGTEGKTGAKSVSKFGERLGKRIGEMTEGIPALKEEKKVKRAAGREKTTMLSEYIEEKKELDFIKTASKKLKNFDAVVAAAKSAGITDKKAISKGYDELKTALTDAEKEIRRLKRSTFRQERRSKQLIDALEDGGVSKTELNGIQALENNILVKHDEVVKGLELALQQVDKGPVGTEVGILNAFLKRYRGRLPIAPSVVTGSTATSPSVSVRLNALEAALASVATALDNAEKAEKEAYTEVEGLIGKFRTLWEK